MTDVLFVCVRGQSPDRVREIRDEIHRFVEALVVELERPPD